MAYDPNEPRDAHGRWTAVGGAIKAAGKAAGADFKAGVRAGFRTGSVLGNPSTAAGAYMVSRIAGAKAGPKGGARTAAVIGGVIGGGAAVGLPAGVALGTAAAVVGGAGSIVKSIRGSKSTSSQQGASKVGGRAVAEATSNRQRNGTTAVVKKPHRSIKSTGTHSNRSKAVNGPMHHDVRKNG